MKKALNLLSVALALVSCVKTQDVFSPSPEARQIAFSPLAQPATKAAIQGTTFPTSNTMEVTAYQSAPSAATYFPKTTFSYQSSKWGGTPARYWPLSAATLNFFAVSGSSLNSADIIINEALSTATVNFKKKTQQAGDPTGTYTNATQSDIMYAFGRGAVTQDGNTLSFNGGNPVALQFKHAMSLIKFQVKAADAASRDITVNSIVLNGASYTGALTLTNSGAFAASSGDVTTTVAWTADAAEDGITVPNSSLTINSSTFVPADGGEEGTWASLVIVPNATKGFDSFTVNYTFRDNSYSYTYTPSPVVPVAAGTVYTYQLTFQLHEITISPSVATWTAPDAIGVSIP